MDIYVYIFLVQIHSFIEDSQTVHVLVDTPQSWIDARRYCRDQYDGNLISRDDVKNISIDISGVESFWTSEYGFLSEWNDIIGCFDESSINVVTRTLIFQDNIIGRCSIHCFGLNSTFFGVKGGRECTCFMNIDGSQVDATSCNTTCEVKGRSSKYLCGGDFHYTVFQKAPRTPDYMNSNCPYKDVCSCAVTQCVDPLYFAQMCDSSIAASCGLGGFKYVRYSSTPVYRSWIDMIDACASGVANAPSSYIDSLLAPSDREVHCNGNDQNPRVIWTNTFRNFVPASGNETFNIDSGSLMCSYCTKSGSSYYCDVYYDTCDSQSLRFLQAVCSYDENTRRTSSSVIQTTGGYLSDKNVTASESVTRRPRRKGRRRNKEGNPVMIAGICGGVGAVILFVIIIVLVVYCKRRKAYNKQTEQMIGGQNNSEKTCVSLGDGKSNLAIPRSNTNKGRRADATQFEQIMEMQGPKDHLLPNQNITPSAYVFDNSKTESLNTTDMPSEHIYDHTNTKMNKAFREEQVMEDSHKGDETYDHTNVTTNSDFNSGYYDHMTVHAEKENMYDVTTMMNNKTNNGASYEGDIYNHSNARSNNEVDKYSSIYYDHGLNA